MIPSARPPLLALLALGLACRAPPPEHGSDAGAERTPAPPPRVQVLALVREEALRRAAWTSSGAVVAVSERRFWWFRPEGQASAKTTLLEGELREVVTARSAEIEVVGGRQRAHVFRGATKVTTFELHSPEEEVHVLSDDGALLVTRAGLAGARVYEVASGALLGVLPSPWVVLSNGGGELALGIDGIRRTRGGTLVAQLASQGGAWVEGRVVSWNRDTLTLLDPSAPSSPWVGPSCPLTREGRARGEDQNDVTFEIDPVGKRAVLFCRGKLRVVDLDARTTTSVGLPPTRAGEPNAPRIAFGMDGAIVLAWHSDAHPTEPRIDALDLPRRTTRPLDVMPPLRGRRGERVLLEAGVLASPDGTSVLRAERTQGVVVHRIDAAGRTLREQSRWGGPERRAALEDPLPLVHAGGLELLSRGVGSMRDRIVRLRLGPSAPPLANVPLPDPGPGCPPRGQRDSDAFPVRRIVSNQEAIFGWFGGAACACAGESCAVLPNGTIARSGARVLTQEGTGPLRLLVSGQQRGALPLDGPPESAPHHASSAVFLDEGAAVAVLASTERGDSPVLTELSVPDLTPRRRWTLPFAAHIVVGGQRSLVAARSFAGTLSARLVARQADVEYHVDVDAWSDGALARFPDGQVELFGTHADQALACLSDDGTVSPFARCRGELEARDRFRVE